MCVSMKPGRISASPMLDDRSVGGSDGSNSRCGTDGLDASVADDEQAVGPVLVRVRRDRVRPDRCESAARRPDVRCRSLLHRGGGQGGASLARSAMIDPCQHGAALLFRHASEIADRHRPRRQLLLCLRRAARRCAPACRARCHSVAPRIPVASASPSDTADSAA